MPDSLDLLPSLPLDEYLPSAQASDIVVTASNRLAREIRGRFAMGARGSAILLPQVLSWRTWLRDCWQQVRLQAVLSGDETIGAATLLSEHQEELLWAETLRQSGANDRVLFLDDTVQACVRSAALADEYKISWDDETWQRDEESSVFHTWYAALKQECKRRKYVRLSRLPEFLARRLATLGSLLGKRILFAGFDEPTPAQSALFRAAASAAGRASLLQAHHPGNTDNSGSAIPHAIFRAASAEEELRAAAMWAAGEAGENPRARIAVVVPDLAELRKLVIEIFDSVFRPPGEAIQLARMDRPFDVSLGERLSENPTARAAIALLPFLQGRASLGDAIYLLRSPYFARAHQEFEARSMVEIALGRHRREDVSLTALREASIEIEARSGQSLAFWKQSILRLEAFDSGGMRAPSAWAAAMRALWVECLWLGEPGLSSAEFQARHRAFEELGALAELDAIVPEMRFNQFARLLKRRFDGATFQPESSSKPILVAGLFEVTGLHFDAVWICGLTDNTLPRPVQPDPFIPSLLQRMHALPRSNARHESEFSERAFARILQLAPTVILSYPGRADQEELEPSPFLRKLSSDREIPISPLSLSPTYLSLPAAIVEAIADWHSAPLADTQKRVQRGSQVLADQSACPFRAFARTRLRSEALSPQTAVMNRMDQGSFVHKALELFWKQTRSHSALLSLSEATLEERIVQCVREALATFTAEPGDLFADAQREAEEIRLVHLLRGWMEHERKRQPFTIVETEKRHTVDLGSIELQLRPDRIDQMEDNTLALIDYKTGIVKRTMWDGKRPEQPQLLVYLAAEQRPVGAVAFASLKTGKTGWELYANDAKAQFSDSKRDATPEGGWPGFLERSHAAVTMLTKQFREGFAPVDPLQGSDTCKYCDQHRFCRIAESAAFDTEDASEEGAD